MQGGLQEHSVGEHYPLAIVGYNTYIGGPVSYFIEDLSKGNVLCHSNGIPLEFEFGEAAEFLNHRPTVRPMLPGRPIYNKQAACWELLPPANPVAVVRLRNMLHRG